MKLSTKMHLLLGLTFGAILVMIPTAECQMLEVRNQLVLGGINDGEGHDLKEKNMDVYIQNGDEISLLSKAPREILTCAWELINGKTGERKVYAAADKNSQKYEGIQVYTHGKTCVMNMINSDESVKGITAISRVQFVDQKHSWKWIQGNFTFHVSKIVPLKLEMVDSEKIIQNDLVYFGCQFTNTDSYYRKSVIKLYANGVSLDDCFTEKRATFCKYYLKQDQTFDIVHLTCTGYHGLTEKRHIEKIKSIVEITTKPELKMAFLEKNIEETTVAYFDVIGRNDSEANDENDQTKSNYYMDGISMVIGIGIGVLITIILSSVILLALPLKNERDVPTQDLESQQMIPLHPNDTKVPETSNSNSTNKPSTENCPHLSIKSTALKTIRRAFKMDC